MNEYDPDGSQFDSFAHSHVAKLIFIKKLISYLPLPNINQGNKNMSSIRFNVSDSSCGKFDTIKLPVYKS